MQTVTRRLVQPAVAEATAAMVAFALVRHIDGIIVEVCEAVTWSPDVRMFLDLPRSPARREVRVPTQRTTAPQSRCRTGQD